MENFKNKTIIMSGGSRGVGLEIAKTLGKDGANVIILAKTTEPHPTLPGTCLLYTSPSPRDGLLSRMPSSA